MPLADDDEMRAVYNLTRFEMQYPKFVFDTASRLLDEVMLGEIKQRMRAAYYSQKIIDSTRIEDISVDADGTIHYSIVSDYESESGFDVAKAREEGTKRHFIKPVRKLALSWVAGYIRLFSKGHWVSGIKKTNIIAKTRKKMEPKVQRMLDEATDKFYLRLVSEG